MPAKRQSSGKRAMILEAKSKEAKGKAHHTQLSHAAKNDDAAVESLKKKPRKRKKTPGKFNVPNPY